MTTTFINSTHRKTGERHQWRYTSTTTTLDRNAYGDPEMPVWENVDTNDTEPLTHIRLVGHTITSTKDVS